MGRKLFTSRASERKPRTVVRLKEKYGTTLNMLFVGSRVCVRGQPQTCGEVVRVIPMTGRVISVDFAGVVVPRPLRTRTSGLSGAVQMRAGKRSTGSRLH